MSNAPRKNHPVRSFVALLVLAVACIGFAELSVARFEDPELYESVTAPVLETYRNVRARIDDYAAELAEERELRRQQELERQRQEEERRRELERQRELAELAAQLASAPTITEKLVFADPTITEFITQSDREVLTGGNIRLYYYNQGDEEWASKPFGRDNIGGYGCGPTALAMAIASTVDDTATPANVASWAASAGYCSLHSGSYLSIVQGAADHYGLNCVSLGVPDAETLCSRLSDGGVIVALMGPGHFTGRGHFILLHGVTLSGGILVADPNSRDNSLAVWEPQTIIDELSRSRHDGAPLWLLTEPLTW